MWYDSADNSAAGGFLNNTTNETDTPKKSGPKKSQSVMPLVIRQIENCYDEEFSLFGIKASILVLVGILRDYEVQSTKATYRIQDHTGTIKAVWWLENDADTTPNLPAVKEGSYVQVFGSLRKKEEGTDENIIMVLRMFPVDDANIVYNHLLQVVHARLEAEHMSKNKEVMIKTNNPGAALANSMTFYDDNMDGTGGANNMGMTPIQHKVFILLQKDSSQNGLHRDAIMKHFPPNQRAQVNDALQFLNNEGHVYSTINNDTFKATDLV
nr:unnamed protein product [Callosobruchus analis]